MSHSDNTEAQSAPTSLSPRQREFCYQYVLTGNLAESVRQAGYSRKNASGTGCRLMAMVGIQEYILKLRVEAGALSRGQPETAVDDVADAMRDTKAETVASLADLFVYRSGALRFRDPSTLSPAALRVIESFEADSAGNIVAYRLNPKHAGDAVCRLAVLAGRG